MKTFRNILLTGLLVISTPNIQAGIIDLGFLLDNSASISDSNWNKMTTGFADALDNLTLDSSYRVTFYGFNYQAFEIVGPTLIDSQTALDGVKSALAAASSPTGWTNTADAFNDLMTVWNDEGVDFQNDLQFINIATDGVPTCIASGYDLSSCGNGGINSPIDDAINAATDAANSGVDSISAEAIGQGQVNFNFLQDIINPYDGVGGVYTPGQTLPNPLEESFILKINTFDDFGTAIDQKIQRITNATAVPEPGILYLFGFGLLALRLATSRKQHNS